MQEHFHRALSQSMRSRLRSDKSRTSCWSLQIATRHPRLATPRHHPCHRSRRTATQPFLIQLALESRPQHLATTTTVQTQTSHAVINVASRQHGVRDNALTRCHMPSHATNRASETWMWNDGKFSMTLTCAVPCRASD